MYEVKTNYLLNPDSHKSPIHAWLWPKSALVFKNTITLNFLRVNKIINRYSDFKQIIFNKINKLGGLDPAKNQSSL